MISKIGINVNMHVGEPLLFISVFVYVRFMSIHIHFLVLPKIPRGNKDMQHSDFGL